MLSPQILVAAAALLDIEGRVLIARRPPWKQMPGLWEFPGGKVEEGESLQVALVRELKEELGIRVRAMDLEMITAGSHSYENFHLNIPLFSCRTWRGKVMPCEGQELFWANPFKLGQYSMPPADDFLILALQKWLQ